jgi:predicted GH43/DUF377 family glycosyl hydrolase
MTSPFRLERYSGNPILSPNPAHEWESRVTTNPGVWYDPEPGVVSMLYRAGGNDREHRIYLGLATSKDGYRFERAGTEPAFGPSLDGFDAGCVEDPRIVKFGEWYYVTYACRPYPPGEYWLPKDCPRWAEPARPADFPWALRENSTSTGLALTKDFKTWKRAGRITNPLVDDRDVILFPEKIGGRYVRLHRPTEWSGPGYPTQYPAIWISFSEDLLDWRDSRLLAKAVQPWEGWKVGANTPPIRTEDGWLTLYHAVGADDRYRLGAMLLDEDEPWRVVGRSTAAMLEPEKEYEIEGYYSGCVFPCGKALIGDTLFVYYGAADKYVALATCSLKELLTDLKSSRCEAAAQAGIR